MRVSEPLAIFVLACGILNLPGGNMDQKPVNLNDLANVPGQQMLQDPMCNLNNMMILKTHGSGFLYVKYQGARNSPDVEAERRISQSMRMAYGYPRTRQPSPSEFTPGGGLVLEGLRVTPVRRHALEEVSVSVRVFQLQNVGQGPIELDDRLSAISNLNKGVEAIGMDKVLLNVGEKGTLLVMENS